MGALKDWFDDVLQNEVLGFAISLAAVLVAATYLRLMECAGTSRHHATVSEALKGQDA